MWNSAPKKKSLLGRLHGVELRAVRDFHLKRVDCRLRVAAADPNALQAKTAPETAQEEATLEARLLLNDFTEAGAAVYSAQGLPLGSAVTIEFENPEKIRVRAKVGWCQQLVTPRRVLTEQRPAYRIGLVFEYAAPEDQEQVKAFCRRLAEVYPGIDLTRAPYAA